jgi:DNA helicase HerA-like ATPase
MGPLLISQMLELNDVQEGIINIAFRFADDDPELKAVDGEGLVDLKDLRELLSYLSKNAKEVSARYGNVAVTAVGAVQRQLLVLENQGGTKFFGEPALAVADLMRTDERGRGIINVLAADKLMASPRSTPPSCCGSFRSCSRSCRRSATRRSRSSCSSSMRRTSCSTRPPRSYSKRSSRWCA